MNSYDVKLKQFTNKFPGRTREQMIKNMNIFRDNFKKENGTVKEKYNNFLTLIKPLNLPSPPSFTSWKYTVYCKEEFKLEWMTAQ